VGVGLIVKQVALKVRGQVREIVKEGRDLRAMVGEWEGESISVTEGLWIDIVGVL
jgi:hypothetical protein